MHDVRSFEMLAGGLCGAVSALALLYACSVWRSQQGSPMTLRDVGRATKCARATTPTRIVRRAGAALCVRPSGNHRMDSREMRLRHDINRMDAHGTIKQFPDCKQESPDCLHLAPSSEFSLSTCV